MDNQSKNIVAAIFMAGLVVGTLDLSAAMIQTIIMGREPLKLMQYISSGMFGSRAFEGGLTYAVLGVVFHYFIAFVWTGIFFIVYPKIKNFAGNKIITGIVYGLFIWLIMNMVVVPLSKIPSRPFNLNNALIGLGILIIAIGIPLSIMAHRFYLNKNI